jgi:N-methylhydantoinase A/oxoprolinase/acetone carboxylase beta subunit
MKRTTGQDRSKTSQWRPATRAIRGGTWRSEMGETSEALFLTSGYSYDDAATVAARFAGGQIVLDPAAAEAACGAAVARPLGLAVAEAALGITEIVTETMASAARVHAVENGKETGGRTMIAFGGAAPLHAARLAQKLGMDRVLVPVGAGVGSAPQ